MKWIILLFLLIGGCTVAAVRYAPESVQVCSKIVEVGGCDHYGQCGVVLENGRIGSDYFPVKGKTSCYMKLVGE